MQIEITKGKGIEGLVSGYVPAEDETVLDVTGQEVFDQLMDRYISFLDQENRIHGVTGYFPKDFNYPAAYLANLNDLETVLTPSEINNFLQRTIVHESRSHYGFQTGKFISKLVQNSYDTGYNRFTLHAALEDENDSIYLYLWPQEDRRMEVTLTGNTERFLTSHVRYIDFHIKGDAQRVSGRGSYLTLTIDGNVSDLPNTLADVTFKTGNPETLKQMCRKVPFGNKIYFIDGEERRIRRPFRYTLEILKEIFAPDLQSRKW